MPDLALKLSHGSCFQNGNSSTGKMTSADLRGRVQYHGCNPGSLSGVDHVVDVNKMVGLGSDHWWGEDVVLARHAGPFHCDS